MAAMIQAEKTPTKRVAGSHRALVIVLVVVLAAHIIVLAALAMFTPKPLHRPEPPKPIAVRFVQVTPPKPLEQPKPKTPEPKKQPKPKEVKVVKAQPKPLPVPKPKPVLTTTTTSKQPQKVIVPPASDAVPEPKLEPVTKPAPEPKPEPVATNTPVLIEGVSYIKPPRLSITERDLKGQARTVKLKITITASGKVEAVQVVSSSGIDALDRKVANALKKATFTPHRINGVAVPAYTIQPFELNLPN